MEPRELIASVSSRLVVNKAAMKRKHSSIQEIVDKLSAAVLARQGGEVANG